MEISKKLLPSPSKPLTELKNYYLSSLPFLVSLHRRPKSTTTLTSSKTKELIKGFKENVTDYTGGPSSDNKEELVVLLTYT